MCGVSFTTCMNQHSVHCETGHHLDLIKSFKGKPWFGSSDWWIIRLNIKLHRNLVKKTEWWMQPVPRSLNLPTAANWGEMIIQSAPWAKLTPFCITDRLLTALKRGQTNNCDKFRKDTVTYKWNLFSESYNIIASHTSCLKCDQNQVNAPEQVTPAHVKTLDDE